MAADVRRVAIRTLGCKVNRTESEALADALAGVARIQVDSDRGADIVVVNTCTVTGEADAKARKAVRHALAQGASVVIATGCLTAVDPDSLRAIDPRVMVEADRAALAARVAALVGAAVHPAPAPAHAASGRTRAMVKVQDGCDRRCGYCIVPDARGSPSSAPTPEVVSRVRSLALAGAREVVLTGVNIGRYRDPGGGGDFAALVEAVCATPISRVRVSSIEPLDLSARTIAALAGPGKVVPHLHVPLQSGCDRTLAEMGRGYDSKRYSAVLAAVRDALPGIAVTTDIMAGFPGETDADFEESRAFTERCGFARLHVFRYSQRVGTPAAARADQVPAPVRARRAAVLRELSERLAAGHLLSRLGQEAEVLVERVGRTGAEGTSEDYLRVRLTGRHSPGDLVRVLITGTDGGRALASPVRAAPPDARGRC